MVGEADYPDCVYCANPLSTVYMDGDYFVYWCGFCCQDIRVKNEELL